jgi:hypothetical protein
MLAPDITNKDGFKRIIPATNWMEPLQDSSRFELTLQRRDWP